MSLPVKRTNIPGPKSLFLAAELRRWENPNVTYISPNDDFPVFWESASGCLVTDADGNSYLDLTAAFGVAAIGHTNPRVVAAIIEQAQKLLHGMGDVHPSAVKVELARKIAERTPGDLGFCIFGQNGGDAVEAAIKTARLFTGKSGVLAFHNGYHGLTFGALAATGRPDFKEPFSGQVPTFAVHVPYAEGASPHPLTPSPSEGRGGTDAGRGQAPPLRISSLVPPLPSEGEGVRGWGLAPIKQAFRAHDIGAVLVEPIQGRGGIVEPPQGWLTALRELCNAYGVLLIADEIFTGWGRTGDWFACDREGVVPDVMCIGKAMGGGFPISACVMRPPLAAAWGESTGEALHTSTFLGNPVGCAAAIAAIAELEEKELPARAQTVGSYFKERLFDLQRRHPDAVLEVRGRGLMLGLRFASRDLALSLVTALLRRGIIVLPAGSGDVLEFVPPLIIETKQIDFAVQQLDESLKTA